MLKIQQDGKAVSIVERHCTSSISVELFINNKANQNDIIKRAGMAMHQEKFDGRNLIRFSI